MNYKILFILFLSLAAKKTAFSQLEGCTDPKANNYNANAIINNGSCTYAASSYSPTSSVELGTTLREISGMTYFKGKILALNDGGNGNKLFMLDTATGAILQTITVAGAGNYDWEDLSQDSSYVYVGDCGNNTSGNRTDLKFYKIDKTAFIDGSAAYTIPATAVQVINFSYPDQTDFTAAPNNTKFDCEAFVVRHGKIHLFTKNWKGGYSVHYSLPIDAGTYVATRLDSLKTDQLMITGASLGGDDEILLTAYYVNSGSPFSSLFAFFLVFGFDHTDYFFNTGNKRKIDLPGLTTSGQVESVCFVNPTHGFISNEYASQSILTITNKLKKFNALSWILEFYKHNPKYPGEPGMVRYNSTLDKYEVFTGTYWEYLNE